MSSVPTIHGDVAPGFEGVADEFRRNFARRGEIGASVAVYRGAEPLVDLWAGTRNTATRAPWERDTTVIVYSTSKGIAGLAIAAAVSAGVLDYDAPVAQYWPEFASHGKASITVRQLIDNQCGLHHLRGRKIRTADLSDHDLVDSVLAEQVPAWEPGTRQGYQAISVGLYEDALFRRVDPKGRSLGAFVREEFATPLGVDFGYGLAADRDIEEVAHPYMSKPLGVLLHERSIAWPIVIGTVTGRHPFIDATSNPPMGPAWTIRRRSVLDQEIPSINGVTNARALARIYGAAAADTGELPISTRVLELITGDAPPPRRDAVLGIDTRYHLGLRRSSPRLQFGSPDGRAFGTPGLGGSLAFGDPSTGIGFGYTVNRLSLALEDEYRCKKLQAAVDEALTAQPGTTGQPGTRRPPA
ncbi:serine hydrolase domain-containing protein [Antrihabitans cavernicola]|uniref:Beta-lactamase family protein n=1 Tax=Antrihabitans cavernicola TaxID=2495913 RepID=A0A5A7SDE9_9NOCA|nr:serine hydrolase domain-containing protein [Spelaeibacter cavernicola]KAA0022241.1 beta-lactamase family protein [Spelaeibacter cavernicola]